MKIAENTLVTLEYRLSVKNENGELELMEETSPENPLRFFYGLGMMLPSLEEHIAGLEPGDSFEFMIPTADAYGEVDDDKIVELTRDSFEVEGEIDSEKVYQGAIVTLLDAEGNRLNDEDLEVKDSGVVVDFNHPLAGDDLYFTGKILTVEQPSEEELQALMSHSCGCSGGCGDGCDSDCNSGGCGGGCN